MFIISNYYYEFEDRLGKYLPQGDWDEIDICVPPLSPIQIQQEAIQKYRSLKEKSMQIQDEGDVYVMIYTERAFSYLLAYEIMRDWERGDILIKGIVIPRFKTTRWVKNGIKFRRLEFDNWIILTPEIIDKHDKQDK